MKFLLFLIVAAVLIAVYKLLAASFRILMSESKVKVAEEAPLSIQTLDRMIKSDSASGFRNLNRNEQLNPEDVEILRLCANRLVVNMDKLSLTYPEAGDILCQAVVTARHMETHLNVVRKASELTCGSLLVTPENRNDHVNFYITLQERQLFCVRVPKAVVLRTGARLTAG